MRDRRIPNNIGSLIALLQEIQAEYGDEVPVSVNLYSDRILALQSVCLDNDYDEVQVLFEADRDNSLEQTSEFMYYSQGK